LIIVYLKLFKLTFSNDLDYVTRWVSIVDGGIV